MSFALFIIYLIISINSCTNFLFIYSFNSKNMFFIFCSWIHLITTSKITLFPFQYRLVSCSHLSDCYENRLLSETALVSQTALLQENCNLCNSRAVACFFSICRWWEERINCLIATNLWLNCFSLVVIYLCLYERSQFGLPFKDDHHIKMNEQTTDYLHFFWEIDLHSVWFKYIENVNNVSRIQNIKSKLTQKLFDVYSHGNNVSEVVHIAISLMS